MANINWYPGHMAKTKRLISENINMIDVVYEVLDARMPYSSKIRDIDKHLKNKPRILIMTKADLADREETTNWENYYKEKGYKVISLNLENNINLTPLIKLTEETMSDMNTKREQKGMTRRKIRVLVVGIPNVGKSTLINRLVGKKATNVGNRPGVTTHLNWIRINDFIELLDSPGILWPNLDENDTALNLASFTAIKEEVLPLDEVTFHILTMLQKYYPDKLLERYRVDHIDNDNYEEVLELIGQKRGCMIKGGVVDYDKVYSAVVNDVKTGLIKGITFDRVNEGE